MYLSYFQYNVVYETEKYTWRSSVPGLRKSLRLHRVELFAKMSRSIQIWSSTPTMDKSILQRHIKLRTQQWFRK